MRSRGRVSMDAGPVIRSFTNLPARPCQVRLVATLGRWVAGPASILTRPPALSPDVGGKGGVRGIEGSILKDAQTTSIR